MKRREMIKAAGVLAATPLFFGGEATPELTAVSVSPGPAGIKRFGDGRDWFFEKRYGMFIHWGLYSIPAWHEQHQWRGRVPREEYVKLREQWNPYKFNPDKWLDIMEMAGMKYITITTKHHDGFCLWDTKQTQFNTMNTPYKKDIIGKLSEACHKRDVPLCLYYSIADWNHPNYPNQGRHHELAGPEKGDQPDWDRYMGFLKAQVRELCSNYGEIHGFWWDMNVPKHSDPTVNDMIRKLQPKAVINNRGFDEGDFGTPERDYETTVKETGFERATEACQSVGMESWGYKKDEDYYTDLHLERSIDRYLSGGANYLLNAGPTALGLIPGEAHAILKRLGKWYNNIKESYEDVKQVSHTLPGHNARLTSRGNTLYVHLSRDTPGNVIKLKPLTVLPVKAVLLNDGRKVECSVNSCPSDHLEQKGYLRLRNLPANDMSDSVMIIRLDFDRSVGELGLM
jgi:alpha-L-fucosidase